MAAARARASPADLAPATRAPTTSMRRIVIVADDLTGALDSAAPFAKLGLNSDVIADASATGAELVQPRADAHVISVNTDSRHQPGPAAAARVAAALGRHARAGDIVFKKIDSTLRGNVAEETLAAMRASGRPIAIVAPAFPAQGRVVRDGIVYVRGVALAKSEFVADALTPAPRDDLFTLFARADPHAAIERFGQAGSPADQPPGRQWLIADAESDQQLDRLIDQVLDRLDQLVLVGSAGLSHALARALTTGTARDWFAGPYPIATDPVAARRDATQPDAVRGRTHALFVVGSRAPVSRRQADCLRAQPDTLCVEAPAGLVSAQALHRVSADADRYANLLLLAVDDASAAPAELVAQRLADATVALLDRLDVRVLVVTGGDTAGAILRRTRNPVLAVRTETMPGIVQVDLSWADRPIAMLTKAGGFGEPDTLIQLAARADAAGA